MHDRLLNLSLVATVLVVAGFFGKTAYDYRRFRILNDDGRIASATVRDVHLAVHNRLGVNARWALDYSFTTPAGEVIKADVGLTREAAAKFRVGQRIDVVYAPSEPSMTALNPEQAWAVVLYDEWVLVPYAALMMMLAWNTLERRRGRGR
jgi:uncharacterized protein DUF3592